MKLELVAVPVSDVDRAKAFYTEKAGFNADHDQVVSEELRFVQLTPPGSACSIAIGTGLTDADPGSVQGLQLDVSDVEAALAGQGRRQGDLGDDGARVEVPGRGDAAGQLEDVVPVERRDPVGQ